VAEERRPSWAGSSACQTTPFGAGRPVAPLRTLPTPGVFSRLAEREHFLADWKLVGSVELLGDLEEGSREIARDIERSLARTARQLEAS
jgi:hypothetical protein